VLVQAFYEIIKYILNILATVIRLDLL